MASLEWLSASALLVVGAGGVHVWDAEAGGRPHALLQVADVRCFALTPPLLAVGTGEPKARPHARALRDMHRRGLPPDGAASQPRAALGWPRVGGGRIPRPAARAAAAVPKLTQRRARQVHVLDLGAHLGPGGRWRAEAPPPAARVVTPDDKEAPVRPARFSPHTHADASVACTAAAPAARRPQAGLQTG